VDPTNTADPWALSLAAHDLPADVVSDVTTVLADAHLGAVDMWVHTPLPQGWNDSGRAGKPAPRLAGPVRRPATSATARAASRDGRAQPDRRRRDGKDR
jgi:crotonobetainyl-CoA:carnitine CoA-transferase CaiB-like acyl-CoA transferase